MMGKSPIYKLFQLSINSNNERSDHLKTDLLVKLLTHGASQDGCTQRCLLCLVEPPVAQPSPSPSAPKGGVGAQQPQMDLIVSVLGKVLVKGGIHALLEVSEVGRIRIPP